MAIAFGTLTHSGQASGAGPFTFSHTAVSSTGGTILFLTCAIPGTTDRVTGATYNSVSMTLVGSKVSSVNAGFVYLFRLYNPPSGAHTISVSVSSNTAIELNSFDYKDDAAAGTGIDQVGSASQATTALTETLTPTLSGMWMVTVTTGTGPDVTANTNCIRRSGVSTQQDGGAFDNNTNALTGGAAFTMTQTAGNTDNATVSCTFNIPVPTVATSTQFLSLLGAGA